MAIEKSAGAVVYRIVEEMMPQFLLLQSAPGKPWGFPKGKIKTGETEEDAARREITEESGLTQLTFDDNFHHVIYYDYRRGRKLINKEVVYFLACTGTSEIQISWEHVDYRWVPVQEAFELVIYENARETLHTACTYLQQQQGLHLE